MLRRMFAALARWRPRVVTLLLLAAIAALIAGANLSEECGQRRIVPGSNPPANFWQKVFAVNPPKLISPLEFDVREPTPGQQQSGNSSDCISFGWPLLWRQYLLYVHDYGVAVVGEASSSGRLAANLAVWLAMLAVPGAVCEWLLRRYWPRLRFSLRTLLAATGLVAAFCGWYASARNRANIQEPIIAAVNARSGRVWIERWGPKWFEAIGAERLCRRIVGVEFNDGGGGEEGEREVIRLLGELKRLPDLRYLSLKADSLSREMAGELGKLRSVETLIIDAEEFPPESAAPLAGAFDGMKRLKMMSVNSFGATVPSECLAATGAAPQLERLRLAGCMIASGALTELAGLTNLKSLTLEDLNRDSDDNPDPPLLLELRALPQLESLELQFSYVFDDDLQYLAALPCLKSLGIQDTIVTSAGLAELARLKSLEELTLNVHTETAERFKSLLKLERLKSLHTNLIGKDSWESPGALRELLADILPVDEIEDCAQALEALRTAKPDLVIDDVDLPFWSEESISPKCETLPERSLEAAARQAVRVWKEQQAAAAASQGPANPPSTQPSP